MVTRTTAEVTNAEPAEPATTDAMRQAWAEAQRNFAWANEHPDAWGAYPGHWVAIAGQRLVVLDADRERFLQRLHDGGWEREGCAPYIIYVPTAEELAAVHPFPHPLEEPADKK